MSDLKRVLEPESMDTPEDAQEFEQMDHIQVNQVFVDDLLAGGEIGKYVVDLGCGPAAIPIELCSRRDDVQVMGIDSAISMLEVAKIQIDFAGLLDQVFLEHADVKDMGEFQPEMAQTVISNSLLHHLAEPQLALQSALYLLESGGRLFFRDLYRPPSSEIVEQLVSQYVGDETDYAQQLFRQSLCAALTLSEIQEIAGGLGISNDHVQMTSDRHWTIDWRKVD